MKKPLPVEMEKALKARNKAFLRFHILRRGFANYMLESYDPMDELQDLFSFFQTDLLPAAEAVKAACEAYEPFIRRHVVRVTRVKNPKL